MKKLLLPIIVTLLCIGCTPANKDLIAVCGDGIVKIIDLSESDGKNIKEVWQWDKDNPQVNLPQGYDR